MYKQKKYLYKKATFLYYLVKGGEYMTDYGITLLPKLFEVTSVISAFRSKDDLSGNENVIESLPFHEFVYVEKGSINILVDGELFSLSPGCLIFYPPNSFRSIVTSRDAVLSIVCFESSSPLLSDFRGQIIRLSDSQYNLLSEIISLGESILTSAEVKFGMVAKQSVSPHAFHRFAGLIELFLLDLHESVTKAPDLPEKVTNSFDDQFIFLTEYLKNHLSENLSLSEISRECNTSISGLHRLCKKQCGTSPLSLYISLKIARSKQLISETDMNFSEISDSLGFSSIHYFSKLFKLKTGMTPSEYAKTRNERN